jgi:hypothetical protein
MKCLLLFIVDSAFALGIRENNTCFAAGLIGVLSLEFEVVKNTGKTRYNSLNKVKVVILQLGC